MNRLGKILLHSILQLNFLLMKLHTLGWLKIPLRQVTVFTIDGLHLGFQSILKIVTWSCDHN